MSSPDSVRTQAGVQITGQDSVADGGLLEIRNRNGRAVATLYADEDGNGVIGAWNPMGEERILKPEL